MPTLDWIGKKAVVNHHREVPYHLLKCDKALSVGDPGSGNLLVQGDNLLALKALLPYYAGRVKCIYIDPPYNTGNEGWVYNDNLTSPQFKEWIGQTVGRESDDATRHDKWCCMMYPRLQLLKELLREDGSIWVSIDDNEVHHLRAIMDEVFGVENFIASAIWQKRTSPDMRLQFSTAHDYIVVYAKNAERVTFNRIPKTPEQIAQYKNPDKDPRGVWVSSDYTAQGYRPNQMYEIHTPGGAVFKPPTGVCWKNVESVFAKLVSDGRIWFGEDGKSMPRRKTYLSESEGNVVSTWWPNEEVGHTQEAMKEIDAILGADHGFNSPKPTRLVKRILDVATEDDSLVLDSFAGSGTTAEAVLRMNEEDHGQRRFVLVQMPFDTNEQKNSDFNICRCITLERVRRVITGQWAIGNQPALEDAFSCAMVGEPLFGEYRDFGETLPSYEEVAKYVFYTATSREIDLKKIDEQSGLIGATDVAGGTSYYLLYTPDKTTSREMSLTTLGQLLKKDKRRHWVVYCEKIWLHPEDLRNFERVNDKRVRPMLVPFDLK